MVDFEQVNVSWGVNSQDTKTCLKLSTEDGIAESFYFFKIKFVVIFNLMNIYLDMANLSTYKGEKVLNVFIFLTAQLSSLLDTDCF